VFVDVTAALLECSSVVEFIGKHISGLPDGAFGIVVSGHDNVERLQEVAPKLRALQQRGVPVALDGFGTGASSLVCAGFPFDTIKLHRCFVRHAHDDPASRRVCLAVAAIGGAVDAAVVADGVETGTQSSCLAALGITAQQGRWCAEPMTVHEMEHRLRSEHEPVRFSGGGSRQGGAVSRS
jgi:EAL domain-containing protein (putative c-di-GMP-specific phosphodiesterase class I)